MCSRLRYRRYPEVKFVVTITRRATFYVYCVYLPVFFLTAIGLFTVWLLPPEQVNDRVTIALTLLLAAVGFRSGISDHLPKTENLTHVDAYLLGCSCLLACLGLESFLLSLSGMNED